MVYSDNDQRDFKNEKEQVYSVCGERITDVTVETGGYRNSLRKNDSIHCDQTTFSLQDQLTKQNQSMVCRSRCCYGFHLLCPLLKCEDTLSKSSYKALVLSTNFSESFQGETTIGLAQPVRTPKWRQFPVCKSAHPRRGGLPCVLPSHWPKYTCSTVCTKYLFQEGENHYSAFSVRGAL